MRTDRLLVEDALDSVREVIANTPATQAEFDANKLLQSHLLRHIQIIGEACWRISQPVKDQHTSIPWRKIAGMRHVLVHDYFQVNWQRVYETARDHVPLLEPELVTILRTIDPPANAS